MILLHIIVIAAADRVLPILLEDVPRPPAETRHENRPQINEDEHDKTDSCIYYSEA